MSRTKTFAMIKPLSSNYRMSDVLAFIECRFLIEEMQLRRLSKHDVDVFYQEHVGKFFYEAMRDYTCSGPVIGMVLSLETDYALAPDDKPHEATAIYRWRHYLGATDSTKAESRTLRGLYGNRAGVMFQNVAHGSDGPEAAMREAGLWGWCLGAFDVYHNKGRDP